jgi:LysM repeat protein
MRKVVLIVGLLLLLQSAWVPAGYAAPPPVAGFWHTVQWGETLFSMGRAFGVNPYSICYANGLGNCNYVWAGQSLWIPAGYSGHDGYGQPGYDGYGQPGRDGYGKPVPVDYGQPGRDGYGKPGYDGYGRPGYDGYSGCSNRYTVRWGDTLYSIGRRYGVGAWSIAAANGIYNLNVLYAGQCLCIPDGRY